MPAAVATSATEVRPIRVCFVTTGLTAAGAETMLVRVVTRIDRTRFTPSVISLIGDGTYGPVLRDAGIRVEAAGFTSRAPIPGRFVRLAQAIRRAEPDVIMGWMYHGNLAATIGRRLAAPRAALAWNIRHSVYDLANERFLTRQLIRLGARWSRGAASTVYVSEISRRQHAALGYAMDRAVVIGNGVEGRPVATAADRAAMRTELGFASSDIVVGHVARHHPMKDHATFLRAASIVAAAVPTVRFLLIGRDVTSDNRALAPLLGAPALAGRVVSLGERLDVQDLLDAIDVFCLSSYSEGFPNVVLEAAAAGIPCVVTDVGAAPEIAGPGALVVPPRDVAAMADALLQWCRASDGERRAGGAAGRAHALARHTLPSVVGRYEDLLEGLAAPSIGQPPFEPDMPARPSPVRPSAPGSIAHRPEPGP